MLNCVGDNLIRTGESALLIKRLDRIGPKIEKPKADCVVAEQLIHPIKFTLCHLCALNDLLSGVSSQLFTTKSPYIGRINFHSDYIAE